jgi:predicted lipoprotein
MWALLLAAAVALVVWPPVRFHRYEAGKPVPSSRAGASGAKANAVSPADAAKRFWSEQLTPLVAKAADAREVTAALRADAPGARKRFARTPALGGPSYFFVTASGKVISKEPKAIGIELDGSATPGKADIVISTGPLFGNAVRDGSGAFAPDDYPNSSDFNALSAELNGLVKANVFPPLREKATAGTHVRIAGIAEVSEDDASPLPLKLVPVSVEFK